MTKNPMDNADEYAKQKAKDENKEAKFKQKLEADAIKHGATPGNLEIPVKTTPSTPDLDAPIVENDPRRVPEKNPDLKK